MTGHLHPGSETLALVLIASEVRSIAAALRADPEGTPKIDLASRHLDDLANQIDRHAERNKTRNARRAARRGTARRDLPSTPAPDTVPTTPPPNHHRKSNP